MCYPTYGGSGVVATELGIALAKKGHEVHFISYNQPFRLDIFSENTFYHEVSYGIDIPIVTTLHGTDITLLGKDKSFKPVIEYAINKSDVVTAVSANLIEETFSHFSINKKIEMIPNFIDSNLYFQELNIKLRNKIAKEDEKILIHISNFRKVKRVEDVIQVFYNVIGKLPSKLLMIGDGPDRVKAERLCRKLKISDRVKFMGKLKSVEMFLSISDIFLLTSTSESFGLVALEAMASKVAVISTNSGGIPEVNINGVTGYLSDVGDVKHMSENAIKLLSNNILLSKFKENALKQSLNFNIHNILPLYENVYDQLLNKK